MMNPQLVKVYSVEFFNYTDCLKDTVSDAENIQYLHIPREGCFLIPEYDLKKYAKFGGGYRTVEYVGCMYIPSVVDNMSDVEILK